jgi:hypothetical protein
VPETLARECRRLQLRHQQRRLCKFGIGYFAFAHAGNTNTDNFNSLAAAALNIGFFSGTTQFGLNSGFENVGTGNSPGCRTWASVTQAPSSTALLLARNSGVLKMGSGMLVPTMQPFRMRVSSSRAP